MKFRIVLQFQVDKNLTYSNVSFGSNRKMKVITQYKKFIHYMYDIKK